ncbi:uncharacterized protein BX664DRAFT_355752 [Halteromyces radiatus]|uniref:uncharacterized protein n=1 Tax=Halteromyces radiatus TaxID=101107 RepID=UPI00221EF035|nr:uncharacterized protein BX664DRAFT_355752 [Halteromyces radiatus]KAI8096384.1 hypothetical protein BX664DRAFT_355752 [Halteromyces radiatus]
MGNSQSKSSQRQRKSKSSFKSQTRESSIDDTTRVLHDQMDKSQPSRSLSINSTTTPFTGLQQKFHECRDLLQPPSARSVDRQVLNEEDSPRKGSRTLISFGGKNNNNNNKNNKSNTSTIHSNNNNNNNRKGSIATFTTGTSAAQSRHTTGSNFDVSNVSSPASSYNHSFFYHPYRKHSLVTTASSSRSLSKRNSIQSEHSTPDDHDQAKQRKEEDGVEDGAKDFWDLRSLNHIRESVNDKQRRTHYFLKRVWNGNYLVPLQDPSLFIQWSSSTGIWCFEMALEFPNTKVIGVDELRPERMASSLPNLNIRQSHLYEPGGGMRQFENNSTDLIAIRDEFMYMVPDDQWEILLTEFYRVLKPGGYLEIFGQNFAFLSTGSAGNKLNGWINHLATSTGVATDFPKSLKGHCDKIGFQNAELREVELPIGEWSRTETLKEMGYLAKIMISKRYKILKHWILGLEHDVSEEEFLDALNQSMDECESYNSRCRCYYVGAQKPLE